MKKLLFLFFAISMLPMLVEAQTVHNVYMDGSSFVPQDITVNIGDTIVWTNRDPQDHTATSGTSCTGDGLFDSGLLGQGEDFGYVAESAGDIPYFCNPHCAGGMTGSISVEDFGGDIHQVIIENFTFIPSSLVINQGDRVHWFNFDSDAHTATSGSPCDVDGLFDSGNLAQGDNYSFEFEDKGEVPYFCKPHCESGMTADLEVVGPSAAKEITSSGTVSVFPSAFNAQTEYLYIQNESGQVGVLTFYTAHGESMNAVELRDGNTEQEIANPLQNAEAGIYYYVLRSERGEKLKSGKLMKMK